MLKAYIQRRDKHAWKQNMEREGFEENNIHKVGKMFCLKNVSL